MAAAAAAAHVILSRAHVRLSYIHLYVCGCVYVRREQIFEQEENDDGGPAGERRAMIGLPLAPTLTPGYTLRRRRRGWWW